jgi:hypothetical protein
VFGLSVSARKMRHDFAQVASHIPGAESLRDLRPAGEQVQTEPDDLVTWRRTGTLRGVTCASATLRTRRSANISRRWSLALRDSWSSGNPAHPGWDERVRVGGAVIGCTGWTRLWELIRSPHRVAIQ